MIRALATILLLLTVATVGQGADDPIRTGYVISPDGVSIYSVQRGEDVPTLVFIHGWCADARYWDGPFEHFAPTHRVVSIDLAGHGASHRNREIFTMESFGEDVAAVLEEFRLQEVILIGHGMGAAAMVEAALAGGDRVIGLVGVEAFGPGITLFDPEGTAAFLETPLKKFRRTCYAEVKTLFPADADSLLVQEIAVDMSTAPSKIAMSSLEHQLTWDTGSAAKRIEELSVPLVTINSDRCPVEESPLGAAIPGYRAWTVPGTGPFPMLEDPETFNRLLADAVAYLAERKTP